MKGEQVPQQELQEPHLELREQQEPQQGQEPREDSDAPAEIENIENTEPQELSYDQVITDNQVVQEIPKMLSADSDSVTDSNDQRFTEGDVDLIATTDESTDESTSDEIIDNPENTEGDLETQYE